MLKQVVVTIFAVLLAACDATCTSRPADARPKVLIFGGGWGPEGTQASIEGHVGALSRALPDATVLFAAGPNEQLRAVQVIAEVDETSAILGQVFDRTGDLHVRYRPTKLAPSKRANKAFLLSTIQSMSAGTLVVIGAGHGVAAREDEPAALELWGPSDRVTAADLAGAITRGAPKGPVALVLGHCHSGAMYDVVHEAADPKRDIAAPPRCVLAAVPADLEAAGCTADVDDPSAPAYLAQFARALKGKDADYDRDGRVGLNEAHTYATIEDPTVDVPVRSSELLVAKILGDAAPNPVDFDQSDIKRGATPTRAAVLERLLPRNLRTAKPAAIAGALTAFDTRIEIASKQLDEASADKERERRILLDAVLSRWPELANPYHAHARALLAGDAKEVVTFITAHPAYAAMQKKGAVVAEIDRTMLELEKRAARIERWLRTAEFVLSERAVRERGEERVVTALEAMLRCERLRL